MKHNKGLCALIIPVLALLGSCGGNNAPTAQTGASEQTASVITTEAATTTTEAATTTTKATTTTTEATTTTPETTPETTAAPVVEDYDRLGHGIDVKRCEVRSFGGSAGTDEDIEENDTLSWFLTSFSPDSLRDGMGYCGVRYGGCTGYDFDCDGREEYIIYMPYTDVMGRTNGSCQLYYLDDNGKYCLLHDAAYPWVDVWDFGGLVLFGVNPDYTNGVYGGDPMMMRAFDGEEPAFVFSSHGEETRFVEESGYIYVDAGHMSGPYYAVVTPESELLWITRDDLSADDITECAKTDTYLTDWLNKSGLTADDINEAYTVGHLSYCLRVRSGREDGIWYTLTADGVWRNPQTYKTEDDEAFIRNHAKAVHGIDLRKLNIV